MFIYLYSYMFISTQVCLFAYLHVCVCIYMHMCMEIDMSSDKDRTNIDGTYSHSSFKFEYGEHCYSICMALSSPGSKPLFFWSQPVRGAGAALRPW